MFISFSGLVRKGYVCFQLCLVNKFVNDVGTQFIVNSSFSFSRIIIQFSGNVSESLNSSSLTFIDWVIPFASNSEL